MAVNFPSAPSDGQIYTDAGQSWKYNSALGKWLIHNSSTPIIAASPPTNDDGQLWYDTTTGILYVRKAGAWVQPTGPADPSVLRDSDIGVLVEAYDPTIYTTADVGVTLAHPPAVTYQTLSGTEVIFTGIPSWATCVELFFANASTNSNSNYICQLGDSGGIETTGYLGGSTGVYGGSDTGINATDGMQVRGNAATDTHYGHIKWVLLDAATFSWVGIHAVSLQSAGPGTIIGATSKSLSAALDRIRFSTAGGTATFDAGTIAMRYS